MNLLLTACLLAVGAPVGVNGPADCTGVGYWLMLQPPMSARRVTAVDGLSDLTRAANVDTVTLNRSPGDAVDWREGTDGRVVTIRGWASDPRALADTIGFIRRTVHIGYQE